MIACISVPADRAAELDRYPAVRRITPIGCDEANRAYALADVLNPIPQLGTAVFLYRDDDALYIQWFKDDRAAILWATVDSIKRVDGLPTAVQA